VSSGKRGKKEMTAFWDPGVKKTFKPGRHQGKKKKKGKPFFSVDRKKKKEKDVYKFLLNRNSCSKGEGKCTTIAVP